MLTKLASFGLAGALLALQGCTQLDVRRHVSSQKPLSSGYAYMLDFTQYEIVLKRTLVACEQGKLPAIKLEASVVAGLAPDAERVYVIDPQSLISAFKTSDISVDYKDGRLVGFNATTVDKTGDVVASVATTAGKIAALAAGVPLAVDVKGQAVSLCTPKAIASLKTVEESSKPLELITNELDAARSKLAVLTAQFANKPTEELRAQITEGTKTIEAAQKKAAELTKASSDAQSWLTDSMSVRWPADSLTFSGGPLFPLPAATTAKWLDTATIRQNIASEFKPSIDNTTYYLRNDDGDGNAAKLGLNMEKFKQLYPQLVEPFDIRSCTSPSSSSARCDALARLRDVLAQSPLAEQRYRDATGAPVSLYLVARGTYGSAESVKQDSGTGLRYRVPAAGWLYICERSQACATDSAYEPVAKVAGPIAQLGSVFHIPFKSSAFASGSVSVTFDDQGRLLHAGLKRDNAAAASAAGAAASVADQAVSLQKALQGAELAEVMNQTALAESQKKLAEAEKALEESPKGKLEEELALLELQAKIDSARKGLAPNRVKDLTTELDIAKLEAQLAQTRQTYAADPQADLVAVKRQYEANANVLNARKAALEAELAVLAAERTLQAQKTP